MPLWVWIAVLLFSECNYVFHRSDFESSNKSIMVGNCILSLSSIYESLYHLSDISMFNWENMQIVELGS